MNEMVCCLRQGNLSSLQTLTWHITDEKQMHNDYATSLRGECAVGQQAQALAKGFQLKLTGAQGLQGPKGQQGLHGPLA